MYRGRSKNWGRGRAKRRDPSISRISDEPRKASRIASEAPPAEPVITQPIPISEIIAQEDACDLAAEEDEPKDEKLLSLNTPSGNDFAAAWYDPESNMVYVVEDTKDTAGWDLAVLLMEQVKPDKVVMSSKAPDSLIAKVTEYCEENPSSSLVALPFRYYTKGAAAYAVSEIVLPDRSIPVYEADIDPSEGNAGSGAGSISGNDNDYYAGMGKLRMSMVKMGCRINVHAPNAIIATGGMLAYMSSLRTGSGMAKRIELAGLESASLERYMHINQDALTSLAIFDTEPHGFQHTGVKKQALSVYGLLNLCITPLGKKLLHLWHLRPLLDLHEIAARHDSIDLFNNPDNQFASGEISRLLRHVCNMSIVLTRMRKGSYRWTDWKRLMDCLAASIEIKEKIAMMSVTAPVPIVEQVVGAINEDLHILSTHISQTIDFDRSRDENRVCIRPGVDHELDSWRLDYAELDAVLTQVASVLRVKVLQSGLGSAVHGVYFPQLGHLASVSDVNLAVELPSQWQWDLAFMTGGIAHYKCPEMRNLDEHYGDISSRIADRETLHAEALCEALKVVECQITAAVDALAELDCLLALAKAAHRYHLVRPTMSDRPTLEIRGGRHILQEMCVDHFVQNDTLLQGGNGTRANSMMIVTGANGSGKSAYGKQVAIIAIMAQIGSFVPAISATVGVCDKVFTRVQTRESVSRAASAFMIDLSQVSLALRGATPRSLLILDEFGKGTTPADGAGLLAGVVEHLLTGPRPRTVVLTHFHELFANSFLPESLPITFCHMKTTFAEGYRGITFLYTLKPTLSMTSSAAECALIHGVPEEVVERGRYVTDCISRFEVSKIHAEAPMDPEQVQDLKNAEEIARKFLKWQIPEGALDVVYQLKELLDSVLDSDDNDDNDVKIERVEEDASSQRIEEIAPDDDDQTEEPIEYDTRYDQPYRVKQEQDIEDDTERWSDQQPVEDRYGKSKCDKGRLGSIEVISVYSD